MSGRTPVKTSKARARRADFIGDAFDALRMLLPDETPRKRIIVQAMRIMADNWLDNTDPGADDGKLLQREVSEYLKERLGRQP